MTLEQVAAELLTAPLQEFTARRKAEARRLRGEDRSLSQAVAKLPKPSTPAWALNVLARDEPARLGELLELGAELREAQEDLAGETLRELTDRAHDLVAAVVGVVRATASANDVALSEPASRQVEQTLRAAMADEAAAAVVRAGLLVKPLAAAGFGGVDLAGAVAVPVLGREDDPRPASRRGGGARGTDTGRAAKVRREAQEALQGLACAQAEADDADRAAEAAGDADAEARRRVEELRAQLEDAEQGAEQAAQALRTARERRDAAARSRKAAERAAERVQRRLERLG